MNTTSLLAIFIFSIAFSLQNKHDKNEAFLSMLVSEYSYGAFARNQPEGKLRETNKWLKSFRKTLIQTNDLKHTFDEFGTKETVFINKSHMQEESKIGWGILKVTMKETPYIFVVFKGTSDCHDLVCDLKWSKQINEELQTKCHNGINEMFVKYHLEETVLEELRKMHNTMSDEHKLKTQIILTGHSLGGGTAQMLGAYFKSKSYLASDRIGELMVETDKNHPNLSGQDRFLEMLTESKIYTIASPQVFTDIHIVTLVVGRDSPAEWDWTNQLGNCSFHYVNQHDPVVEFNILNGKDRQPSNWIEYGEIYYWTNKNKKFGKIDFEKLKKKSNKKTKTQLVLRGIFNKKYHSMRTYLTHFAKQEIEAYETIVDLDDNSHVMIVIALCSAGFICFLGVICMICFACGRYSKKPKHQPQPKKPKQQPRRP